MRRQQVVRRPGHRWQPTPVGGVLRPNRRVSPAWRLPRLRLSSHSMAVRIGMALSAVLAAVLVGWWVYHSPLLSIQHVSVAGTQTLSSEEVLAVADLEGQSILRPDFKGARQRLLGLPRVKDARFSRDWPNGAQVTIVERAPWGLWQVAEQPFVIDDEGEVLDLPPPAGLPVIVQTDPAPPLAPGARVDPGAVALARQLLPTAERTVGRGVLALEFSQASGLTVVFADDPDGRSLRVTFGDTQQYEYKLAVLFALLRRAEEEGRMLRSVDLRFGDRVAIQ